MLIDSHCHLSFKDLGEYSNKTVEILNNAKDKGVTLVLDIVLKQHLLEQALAFSGNHSNVYNAFGIHPCDAEKDYNSILSAQNLTKIIKSSNKLIAIGESGLDYYYPSINKIQQIESFITHCKVASNLQKPIIVHTRNAATDTYNILKQIINNNELTGVIHCFSDDISAARMFLDLDFYISFSGIVTFKNAIAIQEAAKFVPLNKLLIETDSPYLAPVPFRGKINQPAYAYYTAEYLACLKNIELQELAEVTTYNFKKLFKI